MNRRNKQSKSLQSMPHDHLSWRVAHYLNANRAEVLTRADIAAKFDVEASMVDTLMVPAVTAGVVKLDRGTADGNVWRRPQRLRTALPAPFAAPLAAASPAKKAATLVDLSDVKIEAGVALPVKAPPGGRWKAIFDRMGPGDSFALPVRAQHAAGHAVRVYRMHVPTSTFIIRQVPGALVRIWRTA